MRSRFLLSVALAAGLFVAACGQQQSAEAPAPAAPAPAPAAPAQPAGLTPEQISTAMAALPAPYNGANYESGRRVFAQCRSCHTIDAGGGNRVGPNLHHVFNREAGTAPGFAYSQALQDANFTWTADHLEEWLANPQTYLPGNRMAFAGVRNEQQRHDVIAYLMVESAQ